MTLGTKIRGFVSAVGNKSATISRLGHKAGKFVGKFDKGLGKELNEVGDIADKVARVDKDVGDIGTTTGLFKKGGVIKTAGMSAVSGAIGGGAVGGPVGAMGGALGGGIAGLVGPIARTGLSHLATAGIGASSRILSQPIEQLRKRDVITEGGKLSRQARSHLKGFR